MKVIDKLHLKEYNCFDCKYYNPFGLSRCKKMFYYKTSYFEKEEEIIKKRIRPYLNEFINCDKYVKFKCK